MAEWVNEVISPLSEVIIFLLKTAREPLCGDVTRVFISVGDFFAWNLKPTFDDNQLRSNGTIVGHCRGLSTDMIRVRSLNPICTSKWNSPCWENPLTTSWNGLLPPA